MTVPTRGYAHEHADSTQVHIGLAYEALPEPDDRSILQKAAVNILSGGMSGRLFTEVREKRGLCYSVFASYAGQRDRGAILAYSGTSAPRAQETLDVLKAELIRLSEGVQKDEYDRAIVGMKSRLVMQGESTSSRAAAIASDQYTLGYPRSLDEMARRVDAVTLKDVNDFVHANAPGQMTIVTVGPAPLEVH
jgi:predicted Zn-dependent peptidase